MRTPLAATMLVALVAALAPHTARAGVSPDDGYAPDWSYQWHFELAPYAWVPATSASIRLGNGASANVNAGMPTLSQLENVLTGAFMGLGIVRYGPWSAQINIDYVAASHTKGLGPGPFGIIGRTLDVSSSLWRVAPGFGYEVYRGAVGTVPTTIDAQVGFSYFTDSTTLDLTQFGPRGRQLGASSLSDSVDFVQPWLGFRASIIPGRAGGSSSRQRRRGSASTAAPGAGGPSLCDMGGDALVQSHCRLRRPEQPGQERFRRRHPHDQHHRVRSGARRVIHV